MELELNTNKNFLSDNYIIDIFNVHYCDNFPTGYNFDSIFIVQTQETQNANSQSCSTSS